MEDEEQLKYGKLIPKFQPSFLREKPVNWKTKTDLQILLEGDWKNYGNCIGEDDNKFFPTVKVEGEYLYTEEDAKAICQGCPVSRDCLDFAVVTKSDIGIFGGYSPEERKLLISNYEKELESHRRKNE